MNQTLNHAFIIHNEERRRRINYPTSFGGPARDTGNKALSPWRAGGRSRVLSTERTILSPFTKEYRALGTPTGIPIFLDCPSGGPTNRKPKHNSTVQGRAGGITSF